MILNNNKNYLNIFFTYLAITSFYYSTFNKLLKKKIFLFIFLTKLDISLFKIIINNILNI